MEFNSHATVISFDVPWLHADTLVLSKYSICYAFVVSYILLSNRMKFKHSNWEQMTAQEPSAAPIPSWSQLQLKLFLLCGRRIFSKHFDKHTPLRTALANAITGGGLLLTASLLWTTVATLLSFSWFIQFAVPNVRILSPAFKPAASAGLPSTTLLTLANGDSMTSELATPSVTVLVVC